MKQNVKKIISKGALGAAVVAGPAAAFIGLLNAPSPGLWMNIYIVTFVIFVLLHFFFRDEGFDKLEVINTIIWILSPWLAILFFLGFKVGAYVAMFNSLGFLIIIYLMYLLKSIIKSEKQDIS